MTRLIDVPVPDNAPAGVCWQYGPDDTPFVMAHCSLKAGHTEPHSWQKGVDAWRADPEAYLALKREALRQKLTGREETDRV